MQTSHYDVISFKHYNYNYFSFFNLCLCLFFYVPHILCLVLVYHDFWKDINPVEQSPSNIIMTLWSLICDWQIVLYNIKDTGITQKERQK